MPKREVFVATIRVLFDPEVVRMSEACDAVSGLLSEPGNGLLDWAYVVHPTPTLITEPYHEGDFMKEPSNGEE